MDVEFFDQGAARTFAAKQDMRRRNQASSGFSGAEQRNKRMRGRFLCALFIATQLGLSVPQVFAHHSFAATYYTDKTITLKGEVVQFMYRNPHSILQIMAPGEDGRMYRWAVEWAATLILDRDGVKRDVLKPGDKVVVVGQPSRNSADHRVRLKTIERPSDGWKWGGDYS